MLNINYSGFAASNQNACYFAPERLSKGSLSAKTLQDKDAVSFKSRNKTIEGSTGGFFKKNWLKLALGAIAITGGTILAVKTVKNNKIKKEITKLYNSTFDQVAEFCKKQTGGLELQKPTLRFKKLKNSAGGYSIYDNSITIDPRTFQGKLYKTATGVTASGKNDITQAIFKPSQMSCKIDGNLAKLATKDERNAFIVQVLAHETGHAKQLQIGLSLPNAREILIRSYRNLIEDAGKYTDEEVYSLLANKSKFIATFKPNMIVSETEARINLSGGKRIVIPYEKMLENFFSYGDSTEVEYYSQLVEIETKLFESFFARKYLKKIIPGLSDGFISNISKVASLNALKGIEFAEKLAG